MTSPYTRESMVARYYELCDLRDARNAANAPLQAKLDAANAKEQAARAEAMDLAAQIEAGWGGQGWLDLKKEIATLASALRTIPPRA